MAATTERTSDRTLTTLANGLRVVSVPREHRRAVALGAFVPVGSGAEDVRVAGISHLLEHLVFRGTDRFDRREIALQFDAIGADLDAWTTRECTAITTTVLERDLDAALAVIASMIRAPQLEGLEQEREVVLEEIALYDDTPDDLVHDLAVEAVFPDSAYGRPITGTADAVEGITETDLRAHHADHYVGRRVTIAATGAIAHERLVERVAAELESLPAGERLARAAAPIAAAPRRLLVERDTEQCHLCLVGPSIGREDPRRFARAILEQLVGVGASSRLVEEVRERRGLAYSVGMYGHAFRAGGLVVANVGTRPEVFAETVDVIRSELLAVSRGEIAADEVERARLALLGSLELSWDGLGSLAEYVGKTTALGGEVLADEETAAHYAAVSRDDVVDLAREQLDPAALSIACIAPDVDDVARILDACEVGVG